MHHDASAGSVVQVLIWHLVHISGSPQQLSRYNVWGSYYDIGQIPYSIYSKESLGSKPFQDILASASQLAAK